MICVIDYGVGNIHSVLKALRRFHTNVTLTDDAQTIHKAKALVLPGVGAFATGMQGLHRRGLTEIVREKARAGTPILGICLGAQLLLERGFEFGEQEGLGLIPGNVVPFPPLEGEKVPHMGWNSIATPPSTTWAETPLEGIPQGTEMYFVHSFILRPELPEHTLAETTYGSYSFTSVMRMGNIYGCQFHPEKSAIWGLRLLKNFVHMLESDRQVAPYFLQSTMQ